VLFFLGYVGYVRFSHWLAQRRLQPGWRVQGENRTDDPPPDTTAPLASLPPGASCLWGLICACGLCRRDATSSFRSRIADPDAPRAFWR
jgi:hypothetical protein